MAFRRNIAKASDRAIQRKVVMLLISAVILVVLGILVWGPSDQPNKIQLEILAADQFIVQQDTTNYQELASFLRKAVETAKKEHLKNEIEVILPLKIQTEELTPILMLVSAMDLKWNLTYR